MTGTTLVGTSFATSARVWDPDLGEWISEEHRRVAEVIRDYNPYFTLVFVPPSRRTEPRDHQYPYAIVQKGHPQFPDGIIRYLSEADMKEPRKVIAWLFRGDQRRRDAKDILKEIEAEEAAERLLAMKREMDQREDEMKFAEFAFGDRSPHTFRHNGQTYRK